MYSFKMSNIDFYFSIGSTYTYLTVTRILNVEKKHGVKFNWKPFSVRAIMKEMKLDYIPEAEIHMISVGKTPGSRVIPVEITADDISELIDKAKVLQYSIDNDYWPRNTNASKCSDHGCGFYGRCWSDHLIPINESLQKFS